MKHLVWIFFVLGVMVACGAGDTDENNAPSDGSGTGTGGSLEPPNPPIVIIGGAGGLPEEEESASNYVAPVVTGKYLWTANPLSGRVALIDVETLSIEVLSAGLAPTYLAPVATSDDSPSAIVQNVGSANASWFRRVDGRVVETKIPTQLRVNRLVVSASGRYCLFWAVPEDGEVIDASEGLQDLTIADLSATPPKTTRLTVGYRPREVRVSPNEDRVAVVGDGDLTLIDLGDAPATSGYLPLGEGAGRDVSFDATLSHALVRRSGEKRIEVIDLDEPSNGFSVEFADVVTDLDVTSNGLGLAVLREAHAVAVFDLEELLVDPSAYEVKSIPDEIFGSAAIAPNEAWAVLYTTTGATTRVTVLDLEAGADYLSAKSFDTTSGVFDVRIGADGKHAIVIAGSFAGASNTFSVLSLDEARFPRVVEAAGKIVDAAISEDAALVTARGGAENETVIVALPSLALERIPLASAPLRAGFVGAKSEGFVSQSHSEGRVTFYGLGKLDEGDVDVSTITGFELAADVVTQ